MACSTFRMSTNIPSCKHCYRIKSTRYASWLPYQESNDFSKGICMSTFFSYFLQLNQCRDFGSLKRILVTKFHSLSYTTLFHKFPAFSITFIHFISLNASLIKTCNHYDMQHVTCFLLYRNFRSRELNKPISVETYNTLGYIWMF